jgi:hypothetical protein
MYQVFSFTGIYGVETPLVGYDPLLGEGIVRDNIIFQRAYSGMFWIKEGGVSLKGFVRDASGRSLIAGSLLDNNLIITFFGKEGEILFDLAKEGNLYVGKYSGEKQGFSKLFLTKLENGIFWLSAEQKKFLDSKP